MSTLKEKAKKLKIYLPAIYLAMKSKKTPITAKILAMMTIGYALSPIDLIPDFIPVLGYLDDLIILPIMIAMTIKLIPPEIMKESLSEAEFLWKDGKPKKWYYAIPIALIWLIIVYFVAILFLG